MLHWLLLLAFHPAAAPVAAREILDAFRLLMIPLLNPDGAEIVPGP